ncbi:transforming growth factor beta receptor type 3-like [Amphibalanus amphitrite]|uniref:transforming growth factor beta receptor type 3-like n=1 Tax=Amphibalanus amphitrite TaxID=1232801 RepID=UPI001C91FA6C|nr:transforming growth factor beta receptor type 3-like [Amphibalanus amphitrite]
MLFAVKYSHGPPVAYVRAAAFNELDIRLNGGQVNDKLSEILPADDASRVPLREAPVSDASHPPPGDGAGSASGQLRRSVSVSCAGGRLTVAVPSSDADAVSVSLLHLDDWGCYSHRNGTHLVVSGPLTECGTGQRRDRSGATEYFNTVHFVAAPLPEDDEDFEGSGAGIGGGDGSLSSWPRPQRTSGGSVPLSCIPPQAEQPNADQDVTLDIDEVGATMYDLELASDPQFARPVEPNVQVAVSETVYIRATLFMAPYLVPVAEQCWASGAASPASAAASAQVTLVDGACPARSTVTRLTGRDTSSPAAVYRVQVTREFAALGPYYLHCRIGVCATPDSPARQHIVQCLEDPVGHCSAAGVASQTSGRRLASGLQVISKGPFFTSLSADSDGDGDAAGRRPLPPMGVSHETVAGIGVAAFLLGVLLMGGVWLIHTKIGPTKRHHFQAVPQNPGLEPVGGSAGGGGGGGGGGGQSANSTPNSQTPIILAGRAAPPAVGV